MVNDRERKSWANKHLHTTHLQYNSLKHNIVHLQYNSSAIQESEAQIVHLQYSNLKHNILHLQYSSSSIQQSTIQIIYNTVHLQYSNLKHNIVHLQYSNLKHNIVHVQLILAHLQYKYKLIYNMLLQRKRKRKGEGRKREHPQNSSRNALYADISEFPQRAFFLNIFKAHF